MDMYTLYDYSWGGSKNSFADKGYKLLANVDESQSYEVDQAAIYLTPEGKFAYATATGCSCWSGDWGVTDFDSLDEIEETQLREDVHMYSPSLKGFKSLMERAREALDAS